MSEGQWVLVILVCYLWACFGLIWIGRRVEWRAMVGNDSELATKYNLPFSLRKPALFTLPPFIILFLILSFAAGVIPAIFILLFVGLIQGGIAYGAGTLTVRLGDAQELKKQHPEWFKSTRGRW